MHSNITHFNYQAHTHITTTSTSHNQLSHNSNVTQCKICDAMHVVPQYGPKVPPLPIHIESSHASDPDKTKATKCKHIVYCFPIHSRIQATLVFQSNSTYVSRHTMI